MKSNFHLQTRKKNQELHINLHGVFDGSSAFELINVLQEGEKEGLSVFIDTSDLSEAYPFGQSVLDNHLPRNGFRAKLHFSGAWAEGLLPEGCTLLNGGHKKEHHHCKGTCKNCKCRQAKAVKESHLS